MNNYLVIASKIYLTGVRKRVVCSETVQTNKQDGQGNLIIDYVSNQSVNISGNLPQALKSLTRKSNLASANDTNCYMNCKKTTGP